MSLFRLSLAKGCPFLILTFLLLTLAFSAEAQTTIAVQDFETVPAIPTWTLTAGSGLISNATGATDSPASQRIRGGARSALVNNATGTLDLASFPVTGYNSVRITVHISSTSATAGNGADAGDTVRVFTALNGGAFPATPDITVAGASNARWGYNDTVNLSTPTGTPVAVAGTGGTNAGTVYSTLQVTIPNGTTSVALRIIALNNDANEFWNIDDLTLSGTVITAAGVNIGGRVTDSFGRGIAKARITAVSESGATLTALTNPFGYYYFSEVQAGQTYIFGVNSKRFEFTIPTQVFFVTGENEDINFTALPNFNRETGQNP